MAILGAYQSWITKMARPKAVKLPDDSATLSVDFFDQFGGTLERASLELCHVIKRADGTQWRSTPVTSPYEVIAPPEAFDGQVCGHTVDIIYYLDPVAIVPGTVQATAAAVG